jgi:hypothetical protein
MEAKAARATEAEIFIVGGMSCGLCGEGGYVMLVVGGV